MKDKVHSALHFVLYAVYVFCTGLIEPCDFTAIVASIWSGLVGGSMDNGLHSKGYFAVDSTCEIPLSAKSIIHMRCFATYKCSTALLSPVGDGLYLKAPTQ